MGKRDRVFPLEPARQRGLSTTSRRVEASFAGGPRTLERETEPLEATEAEVLLMGPQVVCQQGGNATVAWRWRNYADFAGSAKDPGYPTGVPKWSEQLGLCAVEVDGMEHKIPFTQ